MPDEVPQHIEQFIELGRGHHEPSLGRLTSPVQKKTRLGRQAFQAVQTETATGFAATINDTLVTVAGTDVFLLDALGHKVPTKPATPTALLHLVTRVLAAR